MKTKNITLSVLLFLSINNNIYSFNNVIVETNQKEKEKENPEKPKVIKGFKTPEELYHLYFNDSFKIKKIYFEIDIDGNVVNNSIIILNKNNKILTNDINEVLFFKREIYNFIFENKNKQNIYYDINLK